MEQTNTPTGKNGVPSTIRRPSSTHDEDVLAECTKDAKTKQLFIFDPTMIWCFQRCSELQLAADFENTSKKKERERFNGIILFFFSVSACFPLPLHLRFRSGCTLFRWGFRWPRLPLRLHNLPSCVLQAACTFNVFSFKSG